MIVKLPRASLSRHLYKRFLGHSTENTDSSSKLWKLLEDSQARLKESQRQFQERLKEAHDQSTESQRQFQERLKEAHDQSTESQRQLREVHGAFKQSQDTLIPLIAKSNALTIQRNELLRETNNMNLRSALEYIANSYKYKLELSGGIKNSSIQSVLDEIAAREDKFKEAYDRKLAQYQINRSDAERHRRNIYSEVSKHVHYREHPFSLKDITVLPERCIIEAFLDYDGTFRYISDDDIWKNSRV